MITLLPNGLAAALARLSLVMRNPAVNWPPSGSIEAAVVDEATRRLSGLLHHFDEIERHHFDEIERLQQRIAEMEREKVEHKQSFDLRWNADMRAIKRWQEAHPGNDLAWPDHADLCVWLLSQIECTRLAALAHEPTAGPWRIAPGDPTHVFAPDLAKPINCHSQFRASFVVRAVNAYAADQGKRRRHAEPPGDSQDEFMCMHGHPITPAGLLKDQQTATIGTAARRGSIVLNGYQLREALGLVAPDQEPDQLEAEVFIQYGDNGHSGSGYYCSLVDCSEEGSILLADKPSETKTEPPQIYSGEDER